MAGEVYARMTAIGPITPCTRKRAGAPSTLRAGSLFGAISRRTAFWPSAWGCLGTAKLPAGHDRPGWRPWDETLGDFGGELSDDIAQVRGHVGILPRMLAVECRRRHRQLQLLDHARPGDAERLTRLVVRPHAAVLAQRRADDGQRLVLERAVAVRQ